MTGINSVITKDVPAFVKVAGNPTKTYGLNHIGIKRHGFSDDVRNQLKKAYMVVYNQGLTTNEALEKLQPLAAKYQAVFWFTASIRQSQRGILR